MRVCTNDITELGPVISISDLPTATHIAYPLRYFECEYADTLIRMNYTQNHNFVINSEETNRNVNPPSRW